MKILKNQWLLAIPLLILVIFGFFYFEANFWIRFLVILLAALGVLSFKSQPEMLILLVLYLGLDNLYNIRYSLAVPLSFIMLAVYLLATLSFYLEARASKILPAAEKNLFLLYGATCGLVGLEIFLTMTFWPVDPKIKSLVIVFVFFLIWRLFYFYINNVLHLKRTLILILVTLVILGLVLFFNLHIGF